MEKLTFINSLGESVTMTDSPPFVLTSVQGLGAVQTNIQTQKSPYQDGVTYLGNTLEPRSVSMELSITSNNEFEMSTLRQRLLRVFNPKLGIGTLVYEFGNTQKKLSAIAEVAPTFLDGGDFKETLQPALIQLYSPNPFWHSMENKREEIAVWKPAFEFVLEIPIDEGIEMGYREPSLVANIENNGNVPCGMKIEFKANATVEKPSLFNMNTREFMKVNRTMHKGEVLVVTTHYQNKKILLYKQGQVTNALNWIDLDSTFMQLEVGDNLFRYDAEEGLDNLEVTITYTPQYVGV